MLSSASVATVQRTSEQLRDVMDKDYVRVIKQKLDNVYKGSSADPGARGDKAERENRQSFIVRPSPRPLLLTHTMADPIERLGHLVVSHGTSCQRIVSVNPPPTALPRFRN